jgi:hypothetical protein
VLFTYTLRFRWCAILLLGSQLKKIKIGIAIIQEASVAIVTMPGLLCFPFVTVRAFVGDVEQLACGCFPVVICLHRHARALTWPCSRMRAGARAFTHDTGCCCCGGCCCWAAAAVAAAAVAAAAGLLPLLLLCTTSSRA